MQKDVRLDPMMEATGYQKGAIFMVDRIHAFQPPKKVEVNVPTLPMRPLLSIEGVPVLTVAITNINRNKLTAKHRQQMKDYFQTFGQIVAFYVDCRNYIVFITYTNVMDAFKVQRCGFNGELQLFSRSLRALAADPRNQRMHAKDKNMRIKTAVRSSEDMQKQDIFELNYDIIEMIMSYLPIKDRLQARRVCTVFRDASDSSWGSYEMDLDPLKWFGDASPQDAVHPKVQFTMLSSVLKLVGSRIKSLKLAPVNLSRHFSGRSVPSILGRCVTLSKLDLTGIIMSKKGLQVLQEICCTLTDLKLGPIAPADDLVDEEVQIILEKSILLKKLTCVGINISGSGLLGIKEDLEELKFTYCNNLKSDNIVAVLQILKKLKKFQLCKCRGIANTDTVVAISSPEVTILDFSYTSFVNQEETAKIFDDLYQRKDYSFHEDYFSRLTTTLTPLIISHRNLVELNVAGTLWMNDNLLCEIARCLMNLCYINVDGCVFLTDGGFTNMPNLQLRKLTVNNIDRITGDFFRYLNDVVEFNAQNCKSITLNAISQLIQNNRRLKTIDIRNNPLLRIENMKCNRIRIEPTRKLSIIVDKVDSNCCYLPSTVHIIQRPLEYLKYDRLMQRQDILDFVNV